MVGSGTLRKPATWITVLFDYHAINCQHIVDSCTCREPAMLIFQLFDFSSFRSPYLPFPSFDISVHFRLPWWTMGRKCQAQKKILTLTWLTRNVSVMPVATAELWNRGITLWLSEIANHKIHWSKTVLYRNCPNTLDSRYSGDSRRVSINCLMCIDTTRPHQLDTAASEVKKAAYRNKVTVDNDSIEMKKYKNTKTTRRLRWPSHNTTTVSRITRLKRATPQSRQLMNNATEISQQNAMKRKQQNW